MLRYSILILSLNLVACSSSSTPTDASIIPVVDGLDTSMIPVVGGDNTAMTDEQNGDGSTSMSTEEGGNGESDGFSIDTGVVPGVNVGDLVDVENASVFVTGDGQVETINNDRITDIVITGSNHTVNIESNIGTLSINGSNSIIRFSANVVVDICNVAGSDNTAERAENVSMNCVVEGSGNLGFE